MDDLQWAPGTSIQSLELTVLTRMEAAAAAAGWLPSIQTAQNDDNRWPGLALTFRRPMEGLRQLPAVGYPYAQLAADEVAEEHACQHFGLKQSQLAKLHARQWSPRETFQATKKWRSERVYKVRLIWENDRGPCGCVGL